MREVSSLVASPLMTSTSLISGTGFMKCIPITLSGRLVCAAIFVIEIDEVLLAKITPVRALASMSLNILNLSSGFSVAASMTKSASFIVSMFDTNWIASALELFPLL